MGDIYVVDGQTYRVPPEKLDKFLKEFKNAKKKGDEDTDISEDIDVSTGADVSLDTDIITKQKKEKSIKHITTDDLSGHRFLKAEEDMVVKLEEIYGSHLTKDGKKRFRITEEKGLQDYVQIYDHATGREFGQYVGGLGATPGIYGYADLQKDIKNYVEQSYLLEEANSIDELDASYKQALNDNRISKSTYDHYIRHGRKAYEGEGLKGSKNNLEINKDIHRISGLDMGGEDYAKVVDMTKKENIYKVANIYHGVHHGEAPGVVGDLSRGKEGEYKKVKKFDQKPQAEKFRNYVSQIDAAIQDEIRNDVNYSTEIDPFETFNWDEIKTRVFNKINAEGTEAGKKKTGAGGDLFVNKRGLSVNPKKLKEQYEQLQTEEEKQNFLEEKELYQMATDFITGKRTWEEIMAEGETEGAFIISKKEFDKIWSANNGQFRQNSYERVRKKQKEDARISKKPAYLENPEEVSDEDVDAAKNGFIEEMKDENESDWIKKIPIIEKYHAKNNDLRAAEEALMKAVKEKDSPAINKYRKEINDLKDELGKLHGDVMGLGGGMWFSKNKEDLRSMLTEANYDHVDVEAVLAGVQEAREQFDDNIQQIIDENPDENGLPITQSKALELYFRGLVGEKNHIEKNGKEEMVSLYLPAIAYLGEDYGFSEEFMTTAKEKGWLTHDGKPVGKYKEPNMLQVSVHDLMESGWDYNDFEGWFDKWQTTAHTHTLGEKVLEPSKFFGDEEWMRGYRNIPALSKHDLEKLKQYGEVRDHNHGLQRSVFEMYYLNRDPAKVAKLGFPSGIKIAGVDPLEAVTGFVGNIRKTGSEAVLKEWFDYTEREAAESSLSGFMEGPLTKRRPTGASGRYILDKMQAAANDFNTANLEKFDKGEMMPIIWTDEQQESIKRSFDDNVAEGVGNFVPTLAELAAITVAFELTGGAVGLTGSAGWLQRIYKAGGAWNKIKYHGTKLALEEMKMRIAGFKPGSGAAFYGIGAALRPWFRPGALTNKIAWADPLWSKTVTPGVSGALASEFAQVTELGIEWFKDDKDFQTEFNNLYRDADEVVQRMTTQALVFAIAGQIGKGHLRTRDFMLSRQMKAKYLMWKQNKLDNLLLKPEGRKKLKEQNKKKKAVLKDYRNGKINNRQKSQRLRRIAEQKSKIKKAHGRSSKDLKGKSWVPGSERWKYNTLMEAKGSMVKMFAAQASSAKLDPYKYKTVKNKDGEKRLEFETDANGDKVIREDFKRDYDKVVLDPINAILKELHKGSEKSFKPIESKFLTNTQAKNQLGRGVEARYINDKLIFNQEHFSVGRSNHELVHMALDRMFEKNEKTGEMNAAGRQFFKDMEKIFVKGFGAKNWREIQRKMRLKIDKKSGKVKMDKSLKQEIKEVYRDKTESQRREEFLGFMTEIITSPEMYYTYINKTFLRDAKEHVKHFLEENFQGTKLARYAVPKNEKQFIEFLGRLGAAAQRGERIAGKLTTLGKLEDMDFLGIEFVANRGNLAEARKGMDSRNLRISEKETIDAKEKSETLKTAYEKVLSENKNADGKMTKEGWRELMGWKMYADGKWRIDPESPHADPYYPVVGNKIGPSVDIALSKYNSKLEKSKSDVAKKYKIDLTDRSMINTRTGELSQRYELVNDIAFVDKRGLEADILKRYDPNFPGAEAKLQTYIVGEVLRRIPEIKGRGQDKMFERTQLEKEGFFDVGKDISEYEDILTNGTNRKVESGTDASKPHEKAKGIQLKNFEFTYGDKKIPMLSQNGSVKRLKAESEKIFDSTSLKDHTFVRVGEKLSPAAIREIEMLYGIKSGMKPKTKVEVSNKFIKENKRIKFEGINEVSALDGPYENTMAAKGVLKPIFEKVIDPKTGKQEIYKTTDLTVEEAKRTGARTGKFKKVEATDKNINKMVKVVTTGRDNVVVNEKQNILRKHFANTYGNQIYREMVAEKIDLAEAVSDAARRVKTQEEVATNREIAKEIIESKKRPDIEQKAKDNVEQRELEKTGKEHEATREDIMLEVESMVEKSYKDLPKIEGLKMELAMRKLKGATPIGMDARAVKSLDRFLTSFKSIDFRRQANIAAVVRDMIMKDPEWKKDLEPHIDYILSEMGYKLSKVDIKEIQRYAEALRLLDVLTGKAVDVKIFEGAWNGKKGDNVNDAIEAIFKSTGKKAHAEFLKRYNGRDGLAKRLQDPEVVEQYMNEVIEILNTIDSRLLDPTSPLVRGMFADGMYDMALKDLNTNEVIPKYKDVRVKEKDGKTLVTETMRYPRMTSKYRDALLKRAEGVKEDLPFNPKHTRFWDNASLYEKVDTELASKDWAGKDMNNEKVAARFADYFKNKYLKAKNYKIKNEKGEEVLVEVTWEQTLEANTKYQEYIYSKIHDYYSNALKNGRGIEALNNIQLMMQMQTSMGDGFTRKTATHDAITLVRDFKIEDLLYDKTYETEGEYRSEHELQALNFNANFLLNMLQNRSKPKFLENFKPIARNFKQSIIPKALQKYIDARERGGPTGHEYQKEGVTSDVTAKANFLISMEVASKILDIKTGKTYDRLFSDVIGAGKGLKAVETIRTNLNKLLKNKGVMDARKLTSTEAFNRAKTLDDAITEGKKKLKEKRGMSTFDFDETVGVSENYIFARKGKVTKKIASHEWPFVGEQLRSEGWKLDFTDFNKVTKGKPGPLMQKLKNQIKKFGNENVFILTARDQKSAKAIHEWLKSEGVDIPLKNITGLGNSTGEAKATWMLEKFAEGYNDMYFVDDALPNVRAVKNVLDQLDIKSKVQQARSMDARNLGKDFNKIVEETTGFKAEAKVTRSKAALLGKEKWTSSIVIPGAQDFMGLMQNFMGRGKKGEAHQEFFENSLVRPFAKGVNELNHVKQRVSEDFKSLNRQMPKVKKKLNKKLPDSPYTHDHAIRVHRWNEAGFKIPDTSKTDIKHMVDFVNKDKQLLEYSRQLGKISRLKEGYIEPGKHWIAETVLSDLQKMTSFKAREKYLAEWIENKNIIFSKENLNKIEATQGKKFREALEDILHRMETGSNRPTSSNALANAHMSFINGSVGATMFFNMRSALLQTISATNYINWHDNNPAKAGLAFANQKQYWRDFSMIWNSPMLKQRRAGLKYNVQEAEIAAAVEGSTNKAKAAISWLLKKGFTPTQIADSFAISAGGASMYRNRYKAYKKRGLSEKEAKEKAWLDFQELTEKSQQSSRADLISQQQASVLGRTILAWANTPMQYMRLQEKAARNLINGRGDAKEHISKILYYGAIQSLVFATLQSALFAFGMDDEDEESLSDAKYKERLNRVVNTVVDSQLRGIGTTGSLIAAVKNTALEWDKQEEKGYNKDHTRTILQLTGYSPVIGSKLRKLYSATQTYKYNEDAISEMGFDINNPANLAIANVIEATTNIPLARIVQKVDNMKESMDERNQYWQRIAALLGYARWNVGSENEELEYVKYLIKRRKEEERKRKRSTKKKSKNKSNKFKMFQ